MALTKEILAANSELSNLTDVQIQAITELSGNDESRVIAQKIGGIYSQLDSDLAEASGMQKNQSEKTYDFAKRVVSSFKAQVNDFDKIKTDFESSKAEVATLSKKLEDSAGDAVVKQKLADSVAKSEALQKSLDEARKNYVELEKKNKADQVNSLANMQFELAKRKLTLKPELGPEVSQMLVKQAQDSILSEYTIEAKTDNGRDTELVFRGADGQIVLNEANALKPMTAADLLNSKLKTVLKTETKQEGTGYDGSTNVTSNVVVDISAAKTQVEADETIEKSLLERGFVKVGTESQMSAYRDEFSKIRTTSNVAELPIS